MIARTWMARVPSIHADGFEAHLRATGVAGYRAVEGCLGVWLLRRDEGAWATFLLVSHWESREAVRRYAGDDVEAAVQYPGDEVYGVMADPRAPLYDIVG